MRLGTQKYWSLPSKNTDRILMLITEGNKCLTVVIVLNAVNVDGRVGDVAVFLQFCHIDNSKYGSFLNHCRLSFLKQEVVS